MCVKYIESLMTMEHQVSLSLTGFICLHTTKFDDSADCESMGSIPTGSEIDSPLSEAVEEFASAAVTNF